MTLRTAPRVAAALVATIASNAGAQLITRESLTATGQEYPFDSGYSFLHQSERGISLAGGGRYVAFTTRQPLDVRDTNGICDIYVRDRRTGAIIWASPGRENEPRISSSWAPAFSNDGRYLAFLNGSLNFSSVCVFDMDTRVPHDFGAYPASSVDISQDGRFLAFASWNSSLPLPHTSPCFDTRDPNDITGCSDVYRYDRDPDGDGVFDVGSPVITQMSVDSAGRTSGYESFDARISGDGRFVAFVTKAQDLTPDDNNSDYDVYVHDCLSGATIHASVGPNGEQSPSPCIVPSISRTGRYVSFLTGAAFFPDNINGLDIYIRDLQAQSTRIGSFPPGEFNSPSNGDEQRTPPNSYLSSDSRYVTFVNSHVYRYDSVTGMTSRISIDPAGQRANHDCHIATISGDGRFVAFATDADNLVPGDTNGREDVFVWDSLECADGTVNSAVGPVTDVLRVNGDAIAATTPLGSPISLTLDASPAGPSPASYLVWAWRGFPTNQYALDVLGETLGCTVNPTPLQVGTRPRAFRCFTSQPNSPLASGLNIPGNSPPSAPFTVVRAEGLHTSLGFTFQGVIQDDGATNSQHLSVTNAVTLWVH
ncbi:MAG: PD40 domain-containing protein [Planctomycetes bacterium]|nr:PD40 domain-containing protein [Planctomycetota bacterium]MBI3843763.1 PD40 domain-containing protein [Planctomycetota bacterium]